MAVEGLGYRFNVVHTLGDSTYVNLRDYGAVTFLCQLDAGDTFTVSSATDASGTSAATVVTANSVVAVFTITHSQLPDGHSYVKCPSTSTGTVTAILHDPNVQRTPANLASVIA